LERRQQSTSINILFEHETEFHRDGRLVVLVEFSLTAARDKKSLALFWFNRTGGSGSSGGQLTVRMAKILGVTVGQVICF
jgi:hypothetical protein